MKFIPKFLLVIVSILAAVLVVGYLVLFILNHEMQETIFLFGWLLILISMMSLMFNLFTKKDFKRIIIFLIPILIGFAIIARDWQILATVGVLGSAMWLGESMHKK